MKRILSKNDVATALAEFAKNGNEPTPIALHAALGYRGSIMTLVNYKRELEAVAQEVTHSEEAVQAFKNVYNAAYEQGRKQQEIITNELNELQEDIQALATENERLEGAVAAAENCAMEQERAKTVAQTEMLQAKVKLEGELGQAQAALAHASAQAAKALENLANAQSAHAVENEALQRRISELTQQAHEQELRLVRAESALGAQKSRLKAKA